MADQWNLPPSGRASTELCSWRTGRGDPLLADSRPRPRGGRGWLSKRGVQWIALAACAVSSGYGATNIIDFNTDPANAGLYSWFGNVNDVNGSPAPWRPSGGASGTANDGYLSIADALSGSHSTLVFKDFENGLIIKSFTFDCDLRIGGGTDPAADGFSVSVVSGTDPAVVAADGGTDPTSTFAGIGTETGLPEEGTQTGLSVGFDQWQSGTEAYQDVVGISVRLEGDLIAQFPIPLGPGGTNIYTPDMPAPGSQGNLYTYDNSTTYRNLATNDASYAYSLQTGARNTTDDLNADGVVDATDPNAPQPAYGSPNFDLWMKNLKWEHFHMEVTDAGKVIISWKGRELTPPGGLATSFAPRPARIVFAGRTGGSWSVMHVDNLRLVTQPFTSAAISGFQGNAGGFTLQIADQGTTTLDPTSLSLKLNGTSVTATAVTKTGSTTYVHYNTPQPLGIGSTNVLDITYKDNQGIQSTAQRTFQPASYVTIPASYAMPAGSVDTTSSGFSALMSQIPVGRTPGDANTIANAERQLAGGYLDPATGKAYPSIIPKGPNTDGSYAVTNINWNEFPDSAGGADIGNFRATNDPPTNIPDEPFPGIPGQAAEVTDPTQPGYSDNVVSDITGYLELAAGFYTFGVNSDDGFKVSTGPGVLDVTGLALGSFNGGRGATDTTFDVYVPTAGIYPIRLLYWQGGGGGNVEFFVIDQTTGVKTLINDRSGASAIKAYSKATTSRPSVTRISPQADDLFVAADANVLADITDGTIPVDNGSVSLTVNGTAAGAPTKTGAVTTVTRAGSLTSLLAPGSNNVVLVYGFSGTKVTNSWSFTVPAYATLPIGAKVATGSATGTGFKATVKQMDKSGDANQGNGGRFPGDGNILPRPEVQLANGFINPTNGLPYENLALAGENPDGTFNVTDALNFNVASGNTGVFGGDTQFPGMPGTGTSGSPVGTENFVAEFTTYLDLKAGAYVWGVNTDDGFLVTCAPDPHDTLGTVLGVFNGGRGNSGTLISASAFGVVVPADGTYPIRVLFWQGGGGGNLEFFSVDKTGQQALIGDTATPQAIAAHDTYTGTPQPWVEFSVSPSPWARRTQQAGPGPILFYGRTAANVNAGDIYNSADNTAPWADVGIGAVFANLGSGTVGLMLNGTNVTPTVTPSGTNTTVVYKPAAPLPSGSTNTASLIYAGVTNSWTFTVQTYTNLQASDAAPISAASAGARGFLAKVVQATTRQPNTVARAETQLAGGIANVALPGTNAGGTYILPGIVNWNNNLNPTTSGGAVQTNGTPIGNFQRNVYGTGWPFGDYPDTPVPGLPGTGLGNADNSAAEVFAYLEFDQAGYYRFGVNSDDGFAVKVGTPGQTNRTVIYSLDAGKGASDVPFSFVVPQPGLYPIRLVWYNGGGGANLEFFSYDDTGKKVRINDPSNPQAIKAFYSIATVPQGPQLAVTRNGNNVVISWPTTAGYALQSAPALLSTGTAWTAVSTAPVDSGGTSTVTVPMSATQQYFRLAK